MTRGIRHCGVIDCARVRGSKTDKRGTDEESLHQHQKISGVPYPSLDVAACERTRAHAKQDYREQQREYRAEFAEEDREISKPEDLDAHRGEARQGESDGCGPDRDS